MLSTRLVPAPGARWIGVRLFGVMVALAVGTSAAVRADGPPIPAPGSDPFAGFALPDAWEARFWADPNVKALLGRDPKALAALVPVQAGLRYCRCPACDAEE